MYNSEAKTDRKSVAPVPVLFNSRTTRELGPKPLNLGWKSIRAAVLQSRVAG
jgi:hypothetical protein